MTKKRVTRRSTATQQENKVNRQAYLFLTKSGEFRQTIIPFCEISMMQIDQNSSLIVHLKGKNNTVTLDGNEDPDGHNEFMLRWLEWLERNHK